MVFAKEIYLIAVLVLPCLDAARKSVNVNLETSFLFEPKDASRNMKFINHIRRLLDKLEAAMNPPQSILRSDNTTLNDKKEYFTTFVRDLGKKILSMEDEEVENFFKALHKEMETFYYKGSIFHDIVQDKNLTTYIRYLLDHLAASSSRKIKKRLKKYLTKQKHNTTLNKVGKFLNKYYTATENKFMKEFLEKLKPSQNEYELGDILRNALNTIVFQHYDRMNFTHRSKIAWEVNKLGKIVEPRPVFKTNDEITPGLRDVSRSSQFSGSDREKIITDPNDSLEKDTRKSEMKFIKNPSSKDNLEISVGIDNSFGSLGKALEKSTTEKNLLNTLDAIDTDKR